MADITPIRLLLVDDHQLLRQALAALIQSAPDLEIVDTVPDGFVAVKRAVETRPDVVLMDVCLPGMSGVEATQQIIAQCPEVKVLALSARNDLQTVQAVFDAGALGYLPKDCAETELIEAIRLIASGERYIAKQLRPMLIAEQLIAGDSSSRLSRREVQVLQKITEGLTMKQVARQLQISSKTVETHRRAIMSKLKIFSVTNLTRYAIRNRIVSLDEPVASAKG